MKVTMDAAGRLVIPREIRKAAGLKPGMPLEIRHQDGRVEIEPAPLPVRLVWKGRILVAEPEIDVPTMSAEVVEQTLSELRDDRTFLSPGSDAALSP
jgi:AbrB family looped-hinge helix DNA binding protein